MDRAYPGFGCLHALHLRGGFPVLRAKPDTNLHRLPSPAVDRGLPAMTVADLHRSGCQISPFLVWNRQNLRIRSFPGTSADAVKTQIWIAVSVYVPVAIIRKRYRCEPGRHTSCLV